MNESDLLAKQPSADGVFDAELRKALASVDERLDVEAVTQLVEYFGLSEKVDRRIQEGLQGVWQTLHSQGFAINGVHSEIRDLILDVALLKCAASSLGQVGVLQRQRIEKELILELFPPRLARVGTGVLVAQLDPSAQVKLVDCKERLPICKAACCRVFNLALTAEEVESGKHDWDPRTPYALRKNRLGCVYLRDHDWSCAVRRPTWLLFGLQLHERSADLERLSEENP